MIIRIMIIIVLTMIVVIISVRPVMILPFQGFEITAHGCSSLSEPGVIQNLHRATTSQKRV